MTSGTQLPEATIKAEFDVVRDREGGKRSLETRRAA